MVNSFWGMMRVDKNRQIGAAIAAASVLLSILYLSAVNPYWKITPDSVLYVSGAASIAAGEGYTQQGRPVILYPPMTSMILSIPSLLFPGSYLALNAVTTIFAPLSLVLCFALLRKQIGDLRAGLVVALSLGSTLLFDHSTLLLSDVPYMFFSILALVLAQNVLDRPGSWARELLAGLAVLIACMTRLAGLALILAIIGQGLVSWSKKRTKARPGLLLSMLIPILFVCLWEFRNLLLGPSFFKLSFQNEPWVQESGSITVVGLMRRFLLNARAYGFVGAILSNDGLANGPMTHFYLRLVVWALLCLLFSLGLALALRRKLAITELYTIVFLLIIGLYHPYFEIRWLLPIIPFLFYYTVVGLEFMAEQVRVRGSPAVHKLVYACFGTCVVCYFALGTAYMLRAIPEEHISPFGAYPIKYTFNYDVQRLAMWLRDHSVPGEHYLCQQPNITGFFTDRAGYSFPLTRDPSELLKLLTGQQIKYVLVDKKKGFVQEFLLPTIGAYPDHFHLIQDAEEASLYEFAPPA